MSMYSKLGFKVDAYQVKDLKQLVLNLARPKYLAIISAALGIGYVTYRTTITYLNRRKYRHIPGAPTKG